jgi:metallo-beta-lactamase family protein
MQNPKITFFGGVGSATGANIILDFNLKKIAIDCGLLQGTKFAEEKNFEPFAYNPADIDFLLITHAHMDHIGKVPKFVRDGFKGRIISTKETMELAKPMLDDALQVMRAKFSDKILFDEKDMDKALSLWEGFDYDKKIELYNGCSLEMQNAGHILGSAICDITSGPTKVAFTGDLGNSPSPLLPDTEFLKDTDYIVIESVYGDRNHESKEERRAKLKKYILDGIKKDGTIVIPAFSVERTQVLLYEINNMVEGKEIPEVPVFLDSPLAEKVTDIYKKYEYDFKESVRDEIKKGDDIFDFPNLHIIRKASESGEIEKVKGAKIILAGSGMSEGGRIVNHEAHYLPDPDATIILVGYQAVGTLGRMLQDGAGEVEITPPQPPPDMPSRRAGLPKGEGQRESGFPNREKVKVKAKIETIEGYSSHKDSEHLIEFVEKANESKKLTKVFVIMGEPKSSLFLCQRLRDYADVDAVYPEEGRVYEL